jgi:hypothetical protein
VVTAAGSAEAVVEVSEAIQPRHISRPNGQGVDYPGEDGRPVLTGVPTNELTSAGWRDPWRDPLARPPGGDALAQARAGARGGCVGLTEPGYYRGSARTLYETGILGGRGRGRPGHNAQPWR